MGVPLRVAICLLLLACVQSVTLLSPLPNIVTSEGEVFSFPLASYFSGNEVLFNISDSTGAQIDVDVADPFSLTLKSTYPYSTSNLYSGTSVNSVLMDILLVQGQTYLLNPCSNELSAYSISLGGDVVLLWSLTIETGYLQPVITRVRHYSTGDKTYAMMLIRSLETVTQKQQVPRFDVFAIDISNIEGEPLGPHNLGIEDFRYFTKVDFVPMTTFNNWIILVISTSVVRPTIQDDYLMGYNITDLSHVSWLQTVSAYQDIPGFPDGVKLTTVGIAYIGDMLYVLDQQVGLVTFVFMDEYFLESDFIDIVRFGTPTSVNAPVGGGNFLAIGTNNGLLVIDFTEDDNEYKFIPIVLSDGNVWTPYSAVISSHYVFANAQLGETTSLMVMDYLSAFSSSVKREWNLEETIGDNYLPFGMYTVVQLLEPNSYLYLRSDKDALRAYSMQVGVWAIQGTSSATGPYEVKVTADGGSPLEVISSTLYVDYLSAKNITIMYGSGYALSTEPTGPELIPDIEGTIAKAKIPISSMFSGPDVQYTLTFGSIPAGIALNFSPSFEKVTLLSTSAVADLSEAAVLLAADDQFIYVSDTNAILIYSQDLNLLNKTEFQGLQPVSMDIGPEVVYLLAALEHGIEIVALDKGNFTNVIATVKPNAECLMVYYLINLVYCVAPGEIDVYTQDDLSLVYQITAKSLSLASINVRDITVQFSQYSQRFLLFVSCSANGLFAVDITNLAYNPQTLAVTTVMPTATVGIDLYSPSLSLLVQVNQDGSVFVFDIENSPATYLVRTLPSWFEGTVNSVSSTHTRSFAIVKVNDQIFIYDIYASVHASLFHTTTLPVTCTLSGYSTSLFTLCLEAGNNTLSQYIANGDWSETGFSFTYDVTIHLNLGQFIEDRELIEATVIAMNSFDSSASLKVPISIESEGHIIFQNATSLPSNLLVIPYNVSSKLDLTTVFSGQNLGQYININGQYPFMYYNQSNYDPAILWPVSELTDNYTAPDMDDNNTTLNSILLLPSNLTLTLTTTVLSVFQITGVPHGPWNQVPEATLLTTTDLLDVLENQDLQECPLMSLVAFDNFTALLVVYCQGATEMGLGASGETTYNQISFLNFDLATYNITLGYKDLLVFRPAILKAKPAYEDRHFLFLLIDDPNSGSENNHMVWSEVVWGQNGDVTYALESIVVDFYWLKLDLFCIEDADMMATQDGAVIYVADTCYGLRILEYSKTANPAVFLSNSTALPVLPDSYVTGDILQSISICGGVLYALESSSILLRFTLEKPTAPVPIDPFQRYNTAQNLYKGHAAGMVCDSLDPQKGHFVVARLSDQNGDTIARIFDLDADLNSAILRDIALGPAPPSFTQLFSFGSSSLLATIESSGSSFQVWFFRHPYLEFPVFTQTEYQTMISKWGTYNFTIRVTAVNDQMELNSSAVMITRQDVPPPGPDIHNGGGDDSGSYWWVWLIIAILVVLGFVGAFFLVRWWKRRNSRAPSLSRSEEPLAINEFKDEF